MTIVKSIFLLMCMMHIVSIFLNEIFYCMINMGNVNSMFKMT